jgi:hypothetical protein
MKKLQILIAFLIFSFVLVSCKKDDKEDTPTCRVSKVVYYDELGNIDFSANYKYENNRLSRVEIPGEYSYTLEYTGERITKRRFFDQGSTTANYMDNISYNTDGTISKIEMFEITGNNQSKYLNIDFAYTSGKLNKVTYSQPNSSNTFITVQEHTYTYTGNNITSQVSKVIGNTTQTINLTITHDTNPNHLTKINKQFLLTDAYFEIPDARLFSLLFSSNNVKEIKSIAGNIPVEYNLDAKGNLSSYLLGGQKLAEFTYECQ